MVGGSESDDAPLLDQPVQAPLSVGRAGGRQAYGRAACGRLDVLDVKLVRFFAVAENFLHFRIVEDEADVVGPGVPDGGIGGAHDVAAGDGVPKSQTVGQDQAALLVDGGWDRLVKDGRDYAPESVLRVAIEKVLLAGLHGREGSQDEYPALLAV